MVNSQKNGSVRLLFSAHGLPQKIIDRGDPYADQVQIEDAGDYLVLEWIYGNHGWATIKNSGVTV